MTIGQEAAPAHAAAAHGERRHGMIMARDFAVGRAEARLVAENQRAVVDLFGDVAPARGRRRGIVVARDPHEARARGQPLDLRALDFRQALDRPSRSWKELPRQTTVSGCSTSIRAVSIASVCRVSWRGRSLRAD